MRAGGIRSSQVKSIFLIQSGAITSHIALIGAMIRSSNCFLNQPPTSSAPFAIFSPPMYPRIPPRAAPSKPPIIAPGILKIPAPNKAPIPAPTKAHFPAFANAFAIPPLAAPPRNPPINPAVLETPISSAANIPAIPSLIAKLIPVMIKAQGLKPFTNFRSEGPIEVLNHVNAADSPEKIHPPKVFIKLPSFMFLNSPPLSSSISNFTAISGPSLSPALAASLAASAADAAASCAASI